MSLPHHNFPSYHSIEGQQLLDPVHDNVFDVLPIGDTYDKLLEGDDSVQLSLANYVDPFSEYDVQRIIYGSRREKSCSPG
jgi:hypothetical protein